MNRVFIVHIIELEFFKNDKTVRGETIRPQGCYFICSDAYDPIEKFKNGVKVFCDSGVIDPEITKNRSKFALKKFEWGKQIGGL